MSSEEETNISDMEIESSQTKKARMDTSKSDESAQSGTSIVAGAKDNSSIDSLHLSQPQTPPAGTSTPGTTPFGRHQQTGVASNIGPLIEWLATSAEQLKKIQDEEAQRIAAEEQEGRTITVNIYEDKDFPASDYDLMSDTYKNMDFKTYMRVCLVSMGWSIEKSINAYKLALSTFHKIQEAQGTEQSAAGTGSVPAADVPQPSAEETGGADK